MKKLKLQDLKVHSFVTSINKNQQDELKGGSSIVGNCTTVIFFTYPVQYCANNPTHTCPAADPTKQVSLIMADCIL